MPSAATAFEDVFWSGKDLASIYNRINAPKYQASAMERIFQAGARRCRNSSSPHSGESSQQWIRGGEGMGRHQGEGEGTPRV